MEILSLQCLFEICFVSMFQSSPEGYSAAPKMQLAETRTEGGCMQGRQDKPVYFS